MAILTQTQTQTWKLVSNVLKYNDLLNDLILCALAIFKYIWQLVYYVLRFYRFHLT